MTSFKTAVLTLSVCAVVGAVACSKKEEEVKPVVTVSTAVATKTNLELVVTAEAVLFPKNQAAITPKISAPVRQFLVNRGAKVHKGQLLAVLENRDIAASVTENKGSLEQAQAAYETTVKASLPEDLSKATLDAKSAHESLDAQQKLYDSRLDLFKQGALPRKDLDQSAVALVQAKAQAQLADQHLASMQAVGKQQTQKSAAGQLSSAQGKYQGAEAQLSYTEIRSPIDGVVTDRTGWQGETPAAGNPLITVMDLSTVVARAHIPQEQAAQLKVGGAATITPSEGEDVAGKVVMVGPALDPNSTTVEVWVEVPNKRAALRPGSTAQLKMVAQKIDNAVAVPAEALLKTPEGGTTVMVVDRQNKAHQTEVETGIRSGNLVEIKKGVSAGQTVVTTGAYGLPDGTEVKSAPTTTAKPAAADKEKE